MVKVLAGVEASDSFAKTSFKSIKILICLRKFGTSIAEEVLHSRELIPKVN